MRRGAQRRPGITLLLVAVLASEAGFALDGAPPATPPEAAAHPRAAAAGAPGGTAGGVEGAVDVDPSMYSADDIQGLITAMKRKHEAEEEGEEEDVGDLRDQVLFKRGLPNLIAIGGHKCGVTKFAAYIKGGWGGERGVALVGAEAESAGGLHYFTRKWEGGLGTTAQQERYAAMFPPASECENCTIRFEATPTYLFDYQVPGRLREVYHGALVDDLRLVVVLRNPVERAVSNYLLKVRHVNSDDERRARELAYSTAATVLSTMAEVVEECYGEAPGLHIAAEEGGGGVRCPGSDEEEEEAWAGFFQCANDRWAELVDGPSFDFGILTRGFYADQIQRFICKGFSPGNMMVVPFSALTHIPQTGWLRFTDRFMRSPPGKGKPLFPPRIVTPQGRLWSAPPPPGFNKHNPMQMRKRDIQYDLDMSKAVGGWVKLMHWQDSKGVSPPEKKMKSGLDFQLPADARARLDKLYYPHRKKLELLIAREGFVLPVGGLSRPPGMDGNFNF